MRRLWVQNQNVEILANKIQKEPTHNSITKLDHKNL